MIGHIAEVLLTLFIAFAVGSGVGWLLYRLYERGAFTRRRPLVAPGMRLAGIADPVGRHRKRWASGGHTAGAGASSSHASDRCRAGGRSKAGAASV